MRELHFLSLLESAVWWDGYDGCTLKQWDAGFSARRAWRQQFKCRCFVIQAGKGFNWFILLRQEFAFRGKFKRPSDRGSNSQINYRHQSEWEEPKQNGPLIEHLHFWGIKGNYSLWFAPASAFRRGVGAYGGIKSSSLMFYEWLGCVKCREQGPAVGALFSV